MPRLVAQIAFAAMVWSCLGFEGHSAEPEFRIEKVNVGFDGRYQVGCFVPVNLVLHAPPTGQKPISITVATPDSDGHEVTYGVVDPQGALVKQIDGGARKFHTTIYAKFGHVRSPLTARFSLGDFKAERRCSPGEIPPALSTDTRLILAVGPKTDLHSAIRSLGGRRAAHFEIVHVAPDTLPRQWFGYESVDTIWLSLADGSVLAGMDEPQLEALASWVELGGNLVLHLGTGAEKLYAQDLPFLQAMTPGRFAGQVTLRETHSLETFASADRLDVGGAEPISAAVLADPRGNVLLSQGRAGESIPIIVRAACGFGTVTCLTVDVNEPPLVLWRGRHKLVTTTLGISTADREQRDQHTGSQVRHIGFQDISGQLRAALDQFASVKIIHFSFVAAVIVAFIGIVGPADYFLFNRWLARSWWTWITFPLVVVAVVGGSFAVADWTKGDSLRINQVELVDIDEGSGVIRGTRWFTVFSPSARQFDLRVETDVDTSLIRDESVGATRATLVGERESFNTSQSGCLVSWQGLPGNVIGGLESRPIGLVPSQGYEIASSARARAQQSSYQTHILGLPINRWSSRNLVARWWTRAETDPDLTADSLHANHVGLLDGTIRNPLARPIKNAVLMHGRWAYLVPRIDAGQQLPIDDRLSPRNIETRLRRRYIQEMKDVATPWDPADRNVPRIMEIMMSFELAGGGTYTKLEQNYQPYVDLSHLVELDRAVLVGQLDGPVSTLHDGQQPLRTNVESQWTFVRVVYPVESLVE